MAAPTKSKFRYKLLNNVHEDSGQKINDTGVVRGNYEYFHYLCDGFDDRVSIKQKIKFPYAAGAFVDIMQIISPRKKYCN